MKVLLFILMLLIILVIGGCSTLYNQNSRPAYLKFSGNTDGVTLLIDEINHGLLTENSDKNYTYSYTPGVHEITLLRNEVVILKSSVKLVKGKTTVMFLP